MREASGLRILCVFGDSKCDKMKAAEYEGGFTMITRENLFTETGRVTRMVDGDDFPETANYLEFISRD